MPILQSQKSSISKKKRKKVIYNCTMPKVCSLFKDNASYHSTTKVAKRKEKKKKQITEDDRDW